MAGASPSRAITGRQAERKHYDGTVQFRAGTKRASVRVMDISRLGARVEGVFLVRKGDRFWLKLPGIEAIEARVAWVRHFEFGCEFVRPLHPVVFDALVP